MTTIDDIPADVLHEAGGTLQLRIDRRGVSGALDTLLACVLERTPVALRRDGCAEASVQVRGVHLDAAGVALHAWVAPAVTTASRANAVTVLPAA